jgi:hypothetical protein
VPRLLSTSVPLLLGFVAIPYWRRYEISRGWWR